MHGLDWDDYRFFAALALAGSVRGAAAALRVNASTVTRRLEQLERRIGVELFTRHAHGLEITSRGQEVAERLTRIGRELAAIDDELREDQGRLTGEVVLAIPDAWLPLLIPKLPALHAEEPGLDIELLHTPSGVHSVTADVRVEATPSPAPDLIARPLGRPLCALFARADIASRLDVLRDQQDLFWLSLEDPLLGGEVEPPLRDPGYSALPVRLQTRSLAQQCIALEAGLGIGVLPTGLGARLPSLQVLGGRRAGGMPHWLVSRPQTRRVRRFQVVIEWLRRAWADPAWDFVADGGPVGG